MPQTSIGTIVDPTRVVVSGVTEICPTTSAVFEETMLCLVTAWLFSSKLSLAPTRRGSTRCVPPDVYRTYQSEYRDPEDEWSADFVLPIQNSTASTSSLLGS